VSSPIQPLVDISVGSRFHAFDLARELHSFGMLNHLYTGYPKFSAAQFELPKDRFESVLTHELLNRLFGKLHHAGVLRSRPDAVLSERFDRIVAKRMRPGGNLFVGWSNQSLRCLRTAREFGMTTILERGSSHIEWQRAVLLEERARTGLNGEIPDVRSVERELQEYAAADYIAVPSKFAAATFREKGFPDDRLLVNPYGVNIQRFKVQRRQPESGLRVLHVGRISMQKGVQYLVSAVNKVPGANLTLVGTVDPGMNWLKKEQRVQLVGPVPGHDLPAFYAKADVFCLLSLQEGLALVLAQAMASGLPVIATPNTGVEELIEDKVQGFVIPPRDIDAAADRLQKLADNPALRAEMGARAQAKVSNGFSWIDYGIRARTIYQSVLAVRGRSADAETVAAVYDRRF